MSDIDYKSLPGFTEDSVLDSLVETFNARLVQAESKEHFVGNLTITVRTGEKDHITLPTVRLVTAAHKGNLERARATLFAAYLLRLGREEARRIFTAAMQWESEEFMGWTRLDIEWKRKKLATANG